MRLQVSLDERIQIEQEKLWNEQKKKIELLWKGWLFLFDWITTRNLLRQILTEGVDITGKIAAITAMAMQSLKSLTMTAIDKQSQLLYINNSSTVG